MKNIAEKSLCFLITACFALNVLPQSVIAEDTAGETPSPSPAAEMQTTEPSASPEIPAAEPSAVLQEAETAYTAAEPDPADLQTRNLTADQARSSELGYTVYTDGRDIYFYGTAGNENTPHWYVQTTDGWQPAADSSIESSVSPEASVEPESSTGTEECTDTDTCTGSADGLRIEGDEISGLGQVTGTAKDDIFDSVDLFKPTAKTVTAADLAGKTKVFLFFRATCGNCQQTLMNLVSSGINAYPYIQVILFALPADDGGDNDSAIVTDEFIDEFGLNGYAITYHDFKNIYTDYYYQYENKTENICGAVNTSSLPIFVIIDGDNNIQYFDMGIQPVEAFQKALMYAKKSSTYKKVEGVHFNATELSPVEVGQSVSMKAELEPADASDTRISYSSSNPAVAQVKSDGTIVAKSAGTAVIKAVTAEGGFRASVTVPVYKYPLTAIHASPAVFTLAKGSSKTVQVSYSPSAGVLKDVTWSGGDADIATVKNGVIKAVGNKYGTTTFTVTSQYYPAVSAQVTVNVTPVISRMTFSGTTQKTIAENLILGSDTRGSMEIQASAVADDGTDAVSYMTWIHDNNTDSVFDLVPVSGKENDNSIRTIHAKAAGSSSFKVTAGSQTLTCNVNVYSVDPEAKVTAVLSGYNSAGAEIGDTLQMKAYAGEEDISGKVTFKSSNTSVAAVDAAGSVSVKGTGSAVITAAVTGDLKKRSASLTVKGIAVQVHQIILNAPADDSRFTLGRDANSRLNAVTVDANRLTMNKDTLQLAAALQDKNGSAIADSTGKLIQWTSSDTSVATVSSTGLVTFKKAGELTITAMAKDLYKQSAVIVLSIRDYAPVLETSAYTLNTMTRSGMPFAIHESYGNAVSAVTVYEKTKTGTRDSSFVLTRDEQGQWTLNWKADAQGSAPANGTYKVTYAFETDKGSYQADGTVKVMKAVPAVQVKYSGKVNLFLKDNSVDLVLDHKGYEPESITFTPSAYITGKENSKEFLNNFSIDDQGKLTVVSGKLANDPKTGKPAVKGWLYIRYKGFTDYVAVAVTIPTETVKPDYMLDRTAVSVYSASGSTIDKNVLLQLVDRKTKEQISLKDLYFTFDTKQTTQNVVSALTSSGSSLLMSCTGQTGGKAVILVSNSSKWNDSMSFTVSVSVLKTEPSLSFTGTAQLNLSAMSEKARLTPVIRGNLGNLTLSKVQVAAFKAKAGQSQEDISFTVQDGVLVAAAASSAKTGTYSYQLTPTLKDNSGNTVALTKAVTVNVSVINKAPAVTITSSGSINPIDRSTNAALTINARNIRDELEYVRTDSASFEIVQWDKDTGRIKIAAIAGAPLNIGTEKLTIYLKYKDYETPFSAEVKVNIRQVLPQVKTIGGQMTAYTIFSTDPAIGTAQIVLSGAKGTVTEIVPQYSSLLQEAFAYSYADGRITVTVKDASRIKAGSSSSLKYKLIYEDQAKNTTSFSYVTLTVKDKSSTLKGLLIR